MAYTAEMPRSSAGVRCLRAGLQMSALAPHSPAERFGAAQGMRVGVMRQIINAATADAQFSALFSQALADLRTAGRRPLLLPRGCSEREGAGRWAKTVSGWQQAVCVRGCKPLCACLSRRSWVAQGSIQKCRPVEHI